MIPHALPGLHGGRLAYITTAAAVEPWGFAHTMLTRRQLRQLGFRVTELDVSTAAAPDVRSTLSDADCIYVGGGNSFFLLQELRRTGADALLAERIADGIPYIGDQPVRSSCRRTSATAPSWTARIAPRVCATTKDSV